MTRLDDSSKFEQLHWNCCGCIIFLHVYICGTLGNKRSLNLTMFSIVFHWLVQPPNLPNQGVPAWALPNDRAHHPRCRETEEWKETKKQTRPRQGKEVVCQGEFLHCCWEYYQLPKISPPLFVQIYFGWSTMSPRRILYCPAGTSQQKTKHLRWRQSMKEACNCREQLGVWEDRWRYSMIPNYAWNYIYIHKLNWVNFIATWTTENPLNGGS